MVAPDAARPPLKKRHVPPVTAQFRCRGPVPLSTWKRGTIVPALGTGKCRKDHSRRTSDGHPHCSAYCGCHMMIWVVVTFAGVIPWPITPAFMLLRMSTRHCCKVLCRREDGLDRGVIMSDIQVASVRSEISFLGGALVWPVRHQLSGFRQRMGERGLEWIIPRSIAGFRNTLLRWRSVCGGSGAVRSRQVGGWMRLT